MGVEKCNFKTYGTKQSVSLDSRDDFNSFADRVKSLLTSVL